MDEVVGLVGVYHANGSLRGELAYVVGRLLGSAHCALCDITHGNLRRKPEWDAMVARLGVPVELVHLDEVPADVVAAVEAAGSPLVAGRLADTTVRVLLGPADLELAGSVERFEAAVRAALRG